MAQRLLILPLLAALLFLPGCFWWLAPLAATESASESATVYAPEEDGGTKVRNAIPAIEAYYADHGTYAGATVEVLQQYDNSIQGIKIVKANARTYCIETSAGSFPWFKAGPTAEVLPGDCSMKPLTPATPPQFDPQTNVRAVIPAVEAYYADNGTYRGMTEDVLRRYDPFLPTFKLVRATRNGYCVESTVDSVTFHKVGPRRDVAPGFC